MLIKNIGAAVAGVNALPIYIETSVEIGIQFMLVGLPDNAVKESHYRIATALDVLGYRFPGKKIVINMAPADLKKEGSAYDLPIAMGILKASGQIRARESEHYMMMGELSLDGSLQKIRGALPMALLAKEMSCKGFILPYANAAEAAYVEGLDILGVKHIKEVIDFFQEHIPIMPTLTSKALSEKKSHEREIPDFAEVKGQESAKMLMEIAAAGGHHLLMIGSPGSGKTMLAERLPGILPPLSKEEALETTKIHSVSGLATNGLISERPFRAPHYTASRIAMIGGGSIPQAGEISLAHNGVLFLDELPEFNRSTIEALRIPLESRKISIARTHHRWEFPAAFMLVAAMNPCPCGYSGDPLKHCSCRPDQIRKYMGKISGPILDRIDLQIEVQPVRYEDLSSSAPAESSASIRERIIQARERQQRRFAEFPHIHSNAQMGAKQLSFFCRTDKAGEKLLEQAVKRFGLSARSYAGLLKSSRSIADLDHQENILERHIAQALHYRCSDK